MLPVHLTTIGAYFQKCDCTFCCAVQEYNFIQPVVDLKSKTYANTAINADNELGIQAA